MATVTYHDGFGGTNRAGLSPAKLKEYQFISSKTIGGTSSINKIGGNLSCPLLDEASSITGVATSFYLIRGFSVTCSAGGGQTYVGAAFEARADGGQDHTVKTSALPLDDADGNIVTWATMKGSPFAISYPQPIRLKDGYGLYVEAYNTGIAVTFQRNSITVFYSLVV